MNPFDEAYTKTYLDTMYPVPTEDTGLDQGPEALPAEFQNTEGVSPGKMVRGMMDTAAVGTKGMVQGGVGMIGDLESLARSLVNAFGFKVDEKTALPTTDELRGIFDKYLPISSESVPTMTAADVKAVENIGEMVAPAGPVAMAKGGAKLVKRAIKGAKK